MIVELNQPTRSFTAQQALERIWCLIGQFNVDPNRVMDIILECFEAHLDEASFFIDLLKLYNSSPQDICDVLGFKFTFYRSFPKSPYTDDAPKSLYKLAAILLDKGLVDLLPLCCYVSEVICLKLFYAHRFLL